MSQGELLFRRVAWVACAALLIGCGEFEDDDDDHENLSEASSECASGTKWVGGDEESPNMSPGEDCNACHLREREGPIFTAAGTVYGDYRQSDNCFGLGGLTVEITDVDGRVHTVTTRESGNFYFEEPIPTPYTAKLIGPDGSERPMVAAQTDPNCNSCHTPEGANLAPGRILAP